MSCHLLCPPKIATADDIPFARQHFGPPFVEFHCGHFAYVRLAVGEGRRSKSPVSCTWVQYRSVGRWQTGDCCVYEPLRSRVEVVFSATR